MARQSTADSHPLANESVEVVVVNIVMTVEIILHASASVRKVVVVRLVVRAS
jgi:hypothetical protein